MIGLYFIAVILTWLGLSLWVVVRLGRWRSASNDKNKAKRRVVSALVLLAWFGASFWYSGGRNFYYDWKVRQLCAVDGGVKVYETAPLKPEMLDWAGKIDIPEKNKMKTTDEYYGEFKIDYYRKGTPSVRRNCYRIIRLIDNKIMAESVRYERGGGQLIGPWHPSGSHCPTESSDIETLTFVDRRNK